MPVGFGIDVADVRWSIVMFISCMAAILDIQSRRIPNWLTLPTLLAGIVGSVLWAGATGPVWATASAMIVALPAFVLFAFAGGGAGDVKLLGALGSWLVIREIVPVMLCIALASMICGVCAALLRRRGAVLLSNLARITKAYWIAIASRRLGNAQVLVPAPNEMQTMPYCVPIFVGMCLAAMERWLWQA